MAADIDRLDIQIAATSSGAELRLAKLAASLSAVARSLRKAVDALSEETRSTRENTNATEKNASETNKTAQAKERLAKASGHAASGMTKLLKSIGRIAFYRAIRTAIKGVTTAVREGLQNLYEYSQATGTAFSPAVDELRKHILLLKNAFATALRPVIESIIPIIIKLVDALAKAADFLAQVFSVITGNVDANGRYTKAVLSDLEQSNEQAKELRRTLLGFDEINRLDGESGSSSSSGSGLQFVQAEVSEGARKVAEFIKKIPWDKILEVLKALAVFVAVLKAIKIIKGIIDAIKWGVITGRLNLVLALIAAIIAAFALWGDKIGEWCDKAKKDIEDYFDSTEKSGWTLLDNTTKLTKEISSLFVDSVGSLARLVFALVRGDWATAAQEATHLMFNLIRGIVLGIEAFVEFFTGIIDDIYWMLTKVVQWIWNNVLQPIFNFVAVCIDNIDKALKAVWADLKIAFMKLVIFFAEMLADILRIFNGIVNGIIDTINAVITFIGMNPIPPVNISFDAQVDALNETLKEVQNERDQFEATPFTAELVPKWKDEDLKPLGLTAEVDIKFDSVYKQLDKWENNVVEKIKKTVSNVTGVASGVGGGGKWAVNRNFASGGFPTAGSMFIAGEPGAGAEWVGDIGGRTSVLNAEQMATAIYGAMSAALAANPSGGGDIYLDGEVIYRSVARHNNNNVMATGRSAFLT